MKWGDISKDTIDIKIILKEQYKQFWGCPGGLVVKNLSVSAGDGSNVCMFDPCVGRMPWSRK